MSALSIPRLATTVTQDMRDALRWTLDAVHRDVGAPSAGESAWKDLDPAGRIRQALVPAPIAWGRAGDATGGSTLVLCADAEGQLCAVVNRAGSVKLHRPREGGGNDVVAEAIRRFLEDHPDREWTPELRDVARILPRLRASLSWRTLPDAVPDHVIDHPWRDPVLHAVADAHGADPAAVRRTVPDDTGQGLWMWLGWKAGQPGSAMPGAITGVPDAMPNFTLAHQERPTTTTPPDELVLRLGDVTYRRNGATRVIEVEGDVLPEVVTHSIRPGMRADAICDAPGMSRHRITGVDTVKGRRVIAIEPLPDGQEGRR